ASRACDHTGPRITVQEAFASTVNGIVASPHGLARLLAKLYFLRVMTNVTQILNALEQGDPQAAGQLLPLVYDELRRLAAHRLTSETPGQTLQATALVHEAYLRLVGKGDEQRWDSRGHFFAAAAEAMRRILVENVRRKRSLKLGGGRAREEFDEIQLAAPEPGEDLL